MARSLNSVIPSRVLFVGIGADRYTSGIIQDLRDSGHVAYVAGVIDEDQNSSPFDVIVCHFSECLFANYRNRKHWNHAVDDALYRTISPFEGNILRQMDRLEYEPSALRQKVPFIGTFDQRRQLLFDHLRFWIFTLRTHQIDSVVFHNVPHQVFDTVIYHLCKSLGIRTLLFNVAGAFRDTNFVSESIEDLGCLEFGIQLKRLGSEWHDNELRIFQDWNRVCAIVDNQSVGSVSDSNTYSIIRSLTNDGHVANSALSFNTITRSLSRRLRRIRNRDVSSIRHLGRKLRRLWNVKRSRREEIDNLTESELPEHFFYFPLHFQPEATTSAKGRHFVELYEVALSISQNLPKNVYLVVKEHPHQYQKLLPRPRGYMRRLTSIPQVLIIDSAMSSEELRRKCLGVVTVSGSNGFEVLASGKGVIAFGSAPWREAPRVYVISSQNDVQIAVNELCNGSVLPRDAYSEFLTRLRDGTFLAELSDSRGNRNLEEDRLMEIATRVNITELVRAWLSKLNAP